MVAETKRTDGLSVDLARRASLSRWGNRLRCANWLGPLGHCRCCMGRRRRRCSDGFGTIGHCRCCMGRGSRRERCTGIGRCGRSRTGLFFAGFFHCHGSRVWRGVKTCAAVADCRHRAERKRKAARVWLNGKTGSDHRNGTGSGATVSAFWVGLAGAFGTQAADAVSVLPGTFSVGAAAFFKGVAPSACTAGEQYAASARFRGYLSVAVLTEPHASIIREAVPSQKQAKKPLLLPHLAERRSGLDTKRSRSITPAAYQTSPRGKGVVRV